MPSLPIAEMNSVTEKEFLPVLVDNVYASNALLMRQKKKAKYLEGGASIEVPLVLAKNANVLAYSGYGVWNITPTEELSAATFGWSQYGGPIIIDGKTEALNSGTNAVINIVSAKVQTCEKSIQDKMGTDIYGTNTDALVGFVGLRAAVDDGTNTVTYGGVSRTDWAVWKAQYFANGGTLRALTFALLQQAYGAASIDNDRPTIGFGLQRIFDKYHSMVLPSQRVTNTALENAGFSNLAYNSMLIVVDSHAPANQLFLLNEKWVDLYIHKDRDFDFQPFMQIANQDASVAKIRWMGQVCVSNPRMNSRIVDISYVL